jgi:2,5-diketo-D-gluconate reductase A
MVPAKLPLAHRSLAPAAKPAGTTPEREQTDLYLPGCRPEHFYRADVWVREHGLVPGQTGMSPPKNKGTDMDLKSGITLHTGNKMPVLGLGTWQLTNDTAGTVAAALELGYPMIDTSGDYGTQPGIADGINRSGIARADFFLVTKVEETDDAYLATRKNLDELRLDYADLMLIHRPPRAGAGEDLWRGLIRAKEDGLAKDIGVSNYSIDLIDELIDATGEVPTVNQIEWSPFGYSDGMMRYAQEKKIVIQAYSPLTRTRRLRDETLAGIATKYRKSPAQVLVRWNLQRGTVPLPKANQRQHLEENIAVFDFDIGEEDLETLNRLNERYSSLGALPYI